MSILFNHVNHVNTFMTHYVCTGGCDGVSDEPAACQLKGCIKYELPMAICHCTDGQHAEALANPNNTGAEQPTHEA